MHFLLDPISIPSDRAIKLDITPSASNGHGLVRPFTPDTVFMVIGRECLARLDYMID
jgi:hypothetical protein